LTALSPGSTTITATVEGQTAAATVQVGSDQVTAGQLITSASICALTKAGKPYCWGEPSGWPRLPSYPPNTSTDNHFYMRPTAIGDGTPFVSISLAPRLARTILGLNAGGELYEIDACSATAAKIPTSLTFKQMSSDLVLSTSGDVYNVVRSDYACTDDFSSPIPSAYTLQLLPGGIKFKSLTKGDQHACGLTEAGVAYCWGKNDGGTLGVPVTIPESATPIAVTGGHVFASLSASGSYTVGLLADGTAYQWGHFGVSRAETPQLVPGSLKFTQVSANGGGAIGITAEGLAYAWGDNQYGALGDGTTTSRTSPVAVAGGNKFASVSAGSAYSAGLTTNGESRIWGTTGYGQFGNGDPVNTSYVPVAQKPPGFRLELSASSKSLNPGEEASFDITLIRTGGFTTSGVGLESPVTLSAENAPSGVTITFSPATLGPNDRTAHVRIKVQESTAGSTATITIRGKATGVSDGTSTYALTVIGPTDGNVTLVCSGESTPSGFPAGDHCMTADGAPASPGQFAGQYANKLHGTWFDNVAGVCLQWRPESLGGRAIYKGGIGGGGSTVTEWGKWGVPLRKAGNAEGNDNGTQYYVFTASADPQTRILGYDATLDAIVGWEFTHVTSTERNACPW
jgi:hypothetical protein